MIKAMLVATLLSAPPPDAWFGVDKVKHFAMTAFIQSITFSAARAAGMSHPNAHVVGGVTSMTFAVGKEIHDRRRRRPFSVKDLVWDGAGALVAAALMNGTR